MCRLSNFDETVHVNYREKPCAGEIDDGNSHGSLTLISNQIVFQNSADKTVHSRISCD